MSGAWDNTSFQQGAPGQVKLFDPTQFQAPLSTPASGAPTSQAAYSQPAQTGYNSWNSWGSWDWNPEKNPNAGAGSGSGVASSSDQQQFYPGQGGSQVPQYSQAWNQSWDGAGLQQQHADWDSASLQQQQQQHQPQQQEQQQSDWAMVGNHQQQQQQQPDQQYPAYDQPGTMNGSSNHQHFQPYQQNQGEAVDQSQYGSHQFYNQQFYNQQSQQHYPHHQQPQQQQQQEQDQSFLPQQQEQQQQQPQHHQQAYSEEASLSSGPQSAEEASPPQDYSLDQVHHQHQQPQQFQQGVSGDNNHQQQQQPPQPHQAYYDQPYEASSWTPTPTSADHWGSTAYQQPGVGEQQDPAQVEVRHSESTEEQVTAPLQEAPALLAGAENITASFQQSNSVLDAFDENDNDGTVSGFFGRDEDGDIPSESPRLGRQGTPDTRNHLPVEQPSFQRTQSDISNASLMTLNLPQGEGDENDGDPLHHVQELVQRMEATHLARVASEAAENQSAPAAELPQHLPGMSGDSGVAVGMVGDFPVVSAGFGDRNLSSNSEQANIRGDYSGFGGGGSDYDTTAKPEPPNLPLDTNLRPSSPDGDDQPGSGGSGASGVSSGLADWEIVPSQMSSGPSHSGNSSLDNGVSGTGGGFFTDRPDGGMASSNNSAAVPLASDFTVKPPADGSQPVLPPGTDTGFSFDSTKHQTPSGPTIGQDHGQSDMSPASGIPQQPPVDTQPSSFTAPPPPMLSVPSSGPPPQGGDISGNPFRRDGNKSPRHANPAQPTTSTVSAMPPPPVPTATSSPQEKSQGNRDQGLSALPSRPKPPEVSSTEDGIPARRREPDQSYRQSGQKPESSTSQGRPRHHSAFHPVSRPRQTTMSPATTLWDQEDAPSTNILLAPAMPLIIPALNPYSTSAAATSTSDNDSRSNTSARYGGNDSMESSRSRDKQQSESKEESRRGGGDRREEDANRSFDSLDEIDAASRGVKDRSREHKQRDERNRREADRDRPSSRMDRPQSRSGGQYHYERDRPSSRADGYGRDDPYRRNRAYYRDYGELPYDERYDRPRSRQDESQGSRPTSRAGQQEVDRPRSRANCDRDREYYGRGDRDRDRERHRGYGYDPYGRQADYSYDERDRYYRYYRDKEARYARGYYEEYYGAKQAEQYLQQRQQQQQQQRSSSRAAEKSGSSSRQASRGPTPAAAGSRGNTPGVGAPSPGPDYYGRQGPSRPTSRADYARDYYYKGYDYSGYYYDGYGYDPYYGYGYPGYDESYNQSYDQGRMTPPKYSYPHTRACFGPGGQLVKVLPNRPADGQPALVEVQDVQTLLQACPEAEELHRFPGPLTRANTHKKDVLLFCQLKAKECAENVSMTDRESAQLIWRLLELLIKQNGSVVGTDLSDLLLEGHEPSTHEYALHGLRITQSQSPVIAGAEGEDRSSSRGGDSPALRVVQDRTAITPAASADAEREAWIDRFRHLLLYGRKKDALECAMKNNLWGHALFLASKMDTRAHANVMTRFANNAMRMNDPLQTLYQLMSNRQPAAVTCVSDERWGDWRPHLAMMLSNQTSRSDLDRKSICTLGDTLASKGFLHASHFCYLMAQVSLGTYYKKTSKVVLIGSSHTLPMDEFATTGAIQCTEVYEYAQLLGNQTFCLPHFQMYKYLYACRLADYGMTPEALHYCEVISGSIQQHPAWFKPSFVKLVYQLSSKLKFSDPQRLHTSVDAQDPEWIQQLSQISAAFEDGSLQPVSGAATPANLVGGTTTSSESGDYSAGYYGNSYNGGTGTDLTASLNNTAASADPYSAQQQQQQQQQADSTGYYAGQQVGMGAVESSQAEAASETQPQQQQQLYQQQQDPSQVDYNQQQQQQQQQQQWNEYNQWLQGQQGYQAHTYSEHPHHHYYHHHQQPQEGQQPQEQELQQQQQQQQQQYQNHQQQQQHNLVGGDVDTGELGSPRGSSDVTADDLDDRRSSLGGGSQYDASSGSSTLYGQGYGAQQQQPQQPEQQQPQQFQPFPQGGLPPRASITTNETIEDEQVDDDDDDDEDEVDAAASGFDYFGNVGQVQQQVVAPPHRYRSQSGSSSTGSRRRRTTSGSSTGSVKAAPHKMSGGGKSQDSEPASKPATLTGGDDKKPRPQGAGWLGGLFSKFGRKNNNEMILPDDKDPAIVWDPVKKKWVNADGTEDETHSAAPPPKDTELMGKPPGGLPPASSSAGPGDGAPPPMQANATANRFSLKAKGARNQYVDVNNPKPMSVPSNLFNVMPGTTAITSAAPQVLMPGSAPMPDSQGTNTNNSSQGLLSVPENSDQLSRTSSMSSLSHEVQSFMTKPPAPAADTGVPENSAAPQMPQMPMLFNPASLKGGAQVQGHTGSAGPGLKYGQRRAYPK